MSTDELSSYNFVSFEKHSKFVKHDLSFKNLYCDLLINPHLFDYIF